MRRLVLLLSALSFAAPAIARADDTHAALEPAQLPYSTPRETLIPGTPGMAGGFHFMVNAFAQAQNEGLGAHRIANDGVHDWSGRATYPILSDDWAMGYYRDRHGWVEALVMLNFEPLTIGGAGIPELGQSGEGLWDAQHSHQLLHQAMLAFHPLAGVDGWHPNGMTSEGDYDLSLFGGQGSATIGPPIFMHRASAPGPTVPRKHHKGENPHETVPVLGAALRVKDTWLEASVFGDEELTPEDSRFYPHPSAPTSVAARVRHTFAHALEVQVSGERLRNQGHDEPDAWQASASAYGWGDVKGFRVDGLLDWAVDIADRDTNGIKNTAHGALLELAVRTPSRRSTLWHRSEFNQREEPESRGGGVSTPWFFETLGFEHVVAGGSKSGVQVGVFMELTYAHIPESLQGFYGTDSAAIGNVGLHLFGMWMLGDDFRPMHHAM